MKIILEGPQGCGKSHMMHKLVDFLRTEGRGAHFYFEGERKPSMKLSGPDKIDVIERWAPNDTVVQP